MSSAAEVWTTLQEPWRAAVAQAWESWSAGSAGVGAALTDGAGAVVVKGRNRMAEMSATQLSGTVMAHAEMDVLSQVPLGTQPSGALYTTFEPCLMCAATILLYRVPEVHYAAADPVFDGMHDWFASYPFTAERAPRRARLGGPVGAFCHVLHLSWLVAYPAPDSVISAHRDLAPEHLSYAAEVAERHRLRPLAERGASELDALDELWPDLVALAC
jgi:tRNA(Arg) A34 adenosine deaminase TadA